LLQACHRLAAFPCCAVFPVGLFAWCARGPGRRPTDCVAVTALLPPSRLSFLRPFTGPIRDLPVELFTIGSPAVLQLVSHFVLVAPTDHHSPSILLSPSFFVPGFLRVALCLIFSSVHPMYDPLFATLVDCDISPPL